MKYNWVQTTGLFESGINTCPSCSEQSHTHREHENSNSMGGCGLRSQPLKFFVDSSNILLLIDLSVIQNSKFKSS